MELSLTHSYCNGCKTFKLFSEFIGYKNESVSKQFKTCNNCRQRLAKKRKNNVEIDENQLNNQFEIIDVDFLSEIITNLLNDEPSNKLHLHCGVRISNHENSKEFVDKIVELIEDTDEYNWK